MRGDVETLEKTSCIKYKNTSINHVVTKKLLKYRCCAYSVVNKSFTLHLSVNINGVYYGIDKIHKTQSEYDVKAGFCLNADKTQTIVWDNGILRRNLYT